jgi:PPOX class probable F420-dependent enzyme
MNLRYNRGEGISTLEGWRFLLIYGNVTLLAAAETDGPGQQDFAGRVRRARMEIPEAYHDLFEKPTFAHVVTILPDGKPHPTPVWIDYDAGDNRLLVNTERHRRKTRNVERNPAAAASMLDPEDPYRYLSVVGGVDEITTEGAREHIDELSRRYTGSDYDNPIESERVILRIRPQALYTG